MAVAAISPKERWQFSLHALGVICGLAAGVWLGAAEAPTKLVTAGYSPFAVSLCMVAGVFTARWTFPTLLKGTSSSSPIWPAKNTSSSGLSWREHYGPSPTP